tara:strand:+ start:349 stop:1446 length:1098 start_codon:yes stop_codon:yes gene_type:complete
MKICLIQHTESAHINEFLDLLEKQDIDFEVYYCVKPLKFKKSNNSKINIYSNSLDFNFIKKINLKQNEIIILTGWMNTNLILLNLIFFLRRLNYYYWTDRPRRISKFSFSSFKRLIAQSILKYSNAKILCAGNTALEYFKDLNFDEDKLINFPICISRIEEIVSVENKHIWRKNNFNINNEKVFLITAGSRLEKEKGYDILIKAISLIDKKILKNIKVVIIGEGSELEALKQMTQELNLLDNIIFLGWQKISMFKEVVSNSDLFIHPARYDAYGASIYPLASGIPVIGSINAGVCKERITSGFNGYLFDPNNPTELKEKILTLIKNPLSLAKMGLNAFVDSKNHEPVILIDILKREYEKFFYKEK